MIIIAPIFTFAETAGSVSKASLNKIPMMSVETCWLSAAARKVSGLYLRSHHYRYTA